MAATQQQGQGLALPGVAVATRHIQFHPAGHAPHHAHANGGGGGGDGGSSSSVAALASAQAPAEGEQLSVSLVWPAPTKVGAGLTNLGNTCFLNSVLQCLTYTPPLAAYLQSGHHKVSCRVPGFCAMCCLEEHVRIALASNGKSISPSNLVKNLRSISRTFRMWRQEDAHEYMRCLIDALQKCSLPAQVGKSSTAAEQEKNFVFKIFGGRLRSQVKCTVCSHCSNTYDPFLDLSLEIVRADSLTKALSRFTAVEELDGDNKYRCGHCKKKVRALKNFTIDSAPNVLTIQFKRFSSTPGRFGKIDKKVEFGQSLDLRPYMSNGKEGDISYSLYGVLVHSGSSTHSGHYFCFVRTSTGIWHVLDDSRVRQVGESSVLEQRAYILFYVRNVKSNDATVVGVKEQANATGSDKVKVADLSLDDQGTRGISGLRPAEKNLGKVVPTGLSFKAVGASLPPLADVATSKAISISSKNSSQRTALPAPLQKASSVSEVTKTCSLEEASILQGKCSSLPDASTSPQPRKSEILAQQDLQSTPVEGDNRLLTTDKSQGPTESVESEEEEIDEERRCEVGKACTSRDSSRVSGIVDGEPSGNHDVDASEEPNQLGSEECSTSGYDSDDYVNDHQIKPTYNYMQLLHVIPSTRRYFLARKTPQKARKRSLDQRVELMTGDPIDGVRDDVEGGMTEQVLKLDLKNQHEKDGCLANGAADEDSEIGNIVPVANGFIKAPASPSAEASLGCTTKLDSAVMETDICRTELCPGAAHREVRRGKGQTADDQGHKSSLRVSSDVMNTAITSNGCAGNSNPAGEASLVGSGLSAVQQNPLYDFEVPRWNEKDATAMDIDALLSSHHKPAQKRLDDWDEEYDRGKVKKVRRRADHIEKSEDLRDGAPSANPFQEAACRNRV